MKQTIDTFDNFNLVLGLSINQIYVKVMYNVQTLLSLKCN